MHSAFTRYKSSQVHYSIDGNGPNCLLCFHGYGETVESFQFLKPHIGATHRIIAIDLPFHGKTVWQEGLYFTIDDLISIIDAIFQQQQIVSPTFTLMGFSMGGRVALHLLEVIPQKINKMLLLAPDGLKVNGWYWLSTQTAIGNRVFKFTMQRPNWFFGFLQLADRLKLINPSVFKFIRYYIHDKTVRQQLYDRWTSMRAIKPQLMQVKNNIRQYHIPVHLLYGEYDRIIRHERGEKFKRGIESFCTLQVIQTGHQVLQEKYAELITGLLQS